MDEATRRWLREEVLPRLERSGVRLVPLPGEKVMHAARLIAAVRESHFADASLSGLMPPGSREALVRNETVGAIAAWVEEIGEQPLTAEEIEAWVETMRPEAASLPGVPAVAPLYPPGLVRPLGRCRIPGCERDTGGDGFCLEHAHEAKLEREQEDGYPRDYLRMGLRVRTAEEHAQDDAESPFESPLGFRQFLPAQPVSPFPHVFQRGDTIAVQIPAAGQRYCLAPAPDLPHRVCTMPLGHGGEHEHVLVATPL